MTATPCPCGLDATYDHCCGRFHGGAAATTAEQLMRSRYSAYALRDEPYLLTTWHLDTRPPGLDFSRTLRYTALDVLATTDGGPFHRTGTVEFRAHFTDRGTPDTLHELSTFTRADTGRWVYYNGTIAQ